MAHSEESDEQDLIKRIMLNGKPLELMVSSVLDKFGRENAANADAFVDLEEGKLRDVDMCTVLHDSPPRMGNLEIETYSQIEWKNDPRIARAHAL